VLAAASLSLSLSISRLQRAARESGAARDWARAVDIFRTRRSAAGAFPRPSRTHESDADPQSAASHGRTLTPAGQITESDAAKWAPGAPLASAHSVSSPPGAAARPPDTDRAAARARRPSARLGRGRRPAPLAGAHATRPPNNRSLRSFWVLYFSGILLGPWMTLRGVWNLLILRL
jgi:hypothetical protein